jgi:hypothetical protein
MAKGINRRKYSKLVTFLTATMTDPKIAHRVRMAAATRLNEIYERNEMLNERAAARQVAALEREARLQVSQPPPAPPAPESDTDADAHIKNVFDSILNGRGSHSADAAA